MWLFEFVNKYYTLITIGVVILQSRPLSSQPQAHTISPKPVPIVPVWYHDSLEELQYRQYNIIDIAESRSLGFFGMMKTTCPVDRNVCLLLV